MLIVKNGFGQNVLREQKCHEYILCTMRPYYFEFELIEIEDSSCVLCMQFLGINNTIEVYETEN